jgi:Leucine-rich repeat (LRR) protein
LINLKAVDFSRNKIQTIQFELLKNFTLLEHISFGKNRIVSIPTGTFDKHTNLKRLYLHANKIKRIQNLAYLREIKPQVTLDT